MKILAILAALFLSIGYGHAQTYEKFVEKSFDFLDKNDLVSAEESLRAAMRLEPGNPNNYALLMNLGTIQRRQGKLEDALLSYTAALSRHPNNEAILENRAGLYTEMGEIEKATNDYNALLILNPHHQEALYCRAMLHLQHKNYLLAEQDFDKILEVNEKSVKGRLGHAILEKLRGNYDESERIFNYLISEMPREWILYEGRADLYFMMGKNARAMADINRVFVEYAYSLSVRFGKISWYRLWYYEYDRCICWGCCYRIIGKMDRWWKLGTRICYAQCYSVGSFGFTTLLPSS